MDYAELYPPDLSTPQRMYCETCSTWLRLTFDTFEEDVSGVAMRVSNLPFLECPDGHGKWLPDRSRSHLVSLWEDVHFGRRNSAMVRRESLGTRYGLTDVAFQYAADDYVYIPGLIRDPADGFLTPVFFERTVLLKFANWPGYTIDFASTTYGYVHRGHEYGIAFGLTRSGRVVMWLGDIARLPGREQQFLLSENVPSDHDIGSEFYDGQIEAQFTPRSPEGELIHQRGLALTHLRSLVGEDLAQLDAETLEAIEHLRTPVAGTEREYEDAICTLNQICVESLSRKVLARLITQRGGDAESLGSLKCLERLLSLLDAGSDAARALSPMFVLYDLRVIASHLTSEDRRLETLRSAAQRLGLNAAEESLRAVYRPMVAAMSAAFATIASWSGDPGN